jgi:hypothetical protein
MYHNSYARRAARPHTAHTQRTRSGAAARAQRQLSLTARKWLVRAVR